MKISDLKPDTKNANKGSKRGNTATKASLERFGAGRSIVVDRDNRIIAGNHVVLNAPEAGISDAIIVDSDGQQLVVVRRTDLSLNDPKARELAIADNRVGELGLEWDPAILAELSGELDLKPFFTGTEASAIIIPSVKATEQNPTEVDVDSFTFSHTCPRCKFEFD